MDWFALVTLLAGAVLAIGGGRLQAHLQFTRRLRVAARALYEDLMGQLASCHLEQQRIGHGPVVEPVPDYEGDEQIAVDDAVWERHRATIMELRSTDTYRLIQEAYRAMDTWARLPARHVAEWEMANGLLASDLGVGEASGADEFYEIREDATERTIEKVAAAARRVGKWAKLADTEVERDIQGSRPSSDQEAPGYYFQVIPFRGGPLDDHGHVIEDEIMELELIRPITKRSQVPTETLGDDAGDG